MMYKIRKVEFIEHPVLGDLCLDFCDQAGNAVDTVIFAGMNGVGKSIILNELYRVASHTVTSNLRVYLENGKKTFIIAYSTTKDSGTWVNDGTDANIRISSEIMRKKYPFSGIFSDVDINFHAKNIDTVTSLTLDAKQESRKSSADLPTQIKQLLIDIQALDDADIALLARVNPDIAFKDIKVIERIPRFTAAFNQMFDDLTYSRSDTIGGHKAVLFQKDGTDIPIDALSSGEKQIVYRGCFLLRDVNALNGAFVFIDEPEISLHPTWQEKIMEYYKGMFTNEDGAQTSQIFVVTHSPFVIHNENRKDDKVIVLTRNKEGQIAVSDKPEYYKCDSMELIHDAFSIYGFSADKPTVYLEGRTDEKYFNKALQVYKYDNVPFRFQWIRHIRDDGKEENTGRDALNKAVQFLIGRNLPIKNVCLFDCDTQRAEITKNNVYACVMPPYENAKRMKKGIENALILDDIDVSPFYESKTSEGDYGDDNTIVEFKKMDFCDNVCKMDDSILEVVFTNLKERIDSLIVLFNEHGQ